MLCLPADIVKGYFTSTFGLVMDNERRGGYRWFLRVRAHHSRAQLGRVGWGPPVGPTFIILHRKYAPAKQTIYSGIRRPGLRK